MIKRLWIVVSYCLPALVAVAIILASYYQRVNEAGQAILFYQKAVEQATPENQIEAKLLNQIPDEKIQQLISDFKRKVIEQRVDLSKGGKAEQQHQQVAHLRAIGEVTLDIWMTNSLYVLSMVMLPFLLFGIVLGNSTKLKQDQAQRVTIAYKNIVMKFAVAIIIGIGWMYILNPLGRGVGTIENYLIEVDLTQKETLPIYIRSSVLAPTIAAFLGWYLHMLAYFFTKLIHHDVVSPYVYNNLFKKFLFVYGLAIVLPATKIVPDEQMSVVMLLLGYFPLTAMSLLKEQAGKISGKQQHPEGSLTILPGISRWQILRLEEEGIDTMAALAISDSSKLKCVIPGLASLVDYWADIAHLYSIVGDANYQVLRSRCMTATGFLKLVQEQSFKDYILENKLGDPDEIADQLRRIFNLQETS